jgi:DNA-binding transcriptional LysR family regulator
MDERIPRLPSTTALRMFEATTRHLSFTRAARELRVTQAAVSRQVRLLEEEIGRVLFLRLPRTLQLTAAGQAYRVAVREALTAIARATAELARADERPLTVTASLAFTSTWLVPRLRDFNEQQPDILLRLLATDEVLDLRREGVDLAIRNGHRDWPGYRTRPLFRRELFPVCHPALIERYGTVSTPEDLLVFPLLNLEDVAGSLWDWRAWFAAMGVKRGEARIRLSFNRYEMLLEAALGGTGVILGASDVVAMHLRQGRLVRPLAGMALETEGNQLVWPEDVSAHAGRETFIDWLLREAAETAVSPEAAA